MDQFVLFGDSLTQQTAAWQNDGFIFFSALSDRYVRRLDVINRGFSGYETTKALQVLERALPTPEQANMRFLTVWFGANDACRPDVPGKRVSQHVPLETYTENLRKIVTHPRVRAHKDVRIILITPPPVDERRLFAHDSPTYPGLGDELQRTAETTAKYAQAVRDVGQSEGIAVLDLWHEMLRVSGYQRKDGEPLPGRRDAPLNTELRAMLHDGLHLTGQGYRTLFAALLRLIEERWPDQMPEVLNMVLPKWDDVSAW